MNKKNKMSFNSFVFKKSDLNKFVGFDYFENEKNYKNSYHYFWINENLINNCGFWMDIILKKQQLKKWISFIIVYYNSKNLGSLLSFIENFKNGKNLIAFEEKIVELYDNNKISWTTYLKIKDSFDNIDNFLEF